MSEIMENCSNCRFHLVENGHFCRANPPAAAPVVSQRPPVAMLNAAAGGVEINISWHSSYVPVRPEWWCGRHAPATASMPIAAHPEAQAVEAA